MANNMLISEGDGDKTIRSEDIGGFQHQIVGLPYRVVTGSTMTRPANATPYLASEAVASHATAGSVTVPTLTYADKADMPFTIERLRLFTTDTGLGNGVPFRAWLFNALPTVGAGDNATFVQARANFIGCMSGSFRLFSDGGVAILLPDEGGHIIALPGSGVQTVWLLYQTLLGFTPSGSSTTIIPVAEGFQGRAS